MIKWRSLGRLGIAFGLVSLLASAGCGEGAVAVSAPPTSPPPSPVIIATSTATPLPATPTTTPLSPVPNATPSLSALRTVTLADGGKTIELRAGQRFLLALGKGFDWTITVGDPVIISAVAGVTLREGEQGLFEAKQAGRTTLEAVGDPLCLKEQPPCLAPSRFLEVTIVVRD